MVDLNKTVLIGRLTRDAELKYTATGQPVSKFSIAVNRRRKNGDNWEDEANFFDIVLWGKTAESLDQYLVKGKRIAVEGELRQERWEKDGVHRSRVEVVANLVQLLDGKDNGQQGQSEPQQGNFTPRSSTVAPPSVPAKSRDYAQPSYIPPPNDDGFEDDIPF